MASPKYFACVSFPSQAIDQRYIQICEIARTRSIISLGICCFIDENGGSGAAVPADPAGSGAAGAGHAAAAPAGFYTAGVGRAAESVASALRDHAAAPNAAHASPLGYAHGARQAQAPPSYSVYVYNVATLSTENYVCEPAAATFLAEHHFDFNTQIRHGVR